MIIVLCSSSNSRFGTGDIDVNCYDCQDDKDYDLLSRVGAIRLLDAISSVCKDNFICHNWKKVKSDFSNSRNSMKSNDIKKRRDSNYGLNHSMRGSIKVSSNQHKGHYSNVNNNFSHDRYKNTGPLDRLKHTGPLIHYK